MNTASPIWVKICANTSLADAQLAAAAGADAVGFVFAPSPRRVTADQVAKITTHLPSTLEKIGIFVDARLDEICAIVQASRLTGVQLHSQGEPDLPARLRAQFGPQLRILRVVHFGSHAGEQASQIAADPHTDAILIDSRTATAVGGTGLTFDWTAARESIFGHSPLAKFVAAGGLTPENVRAAIATLRPWGVDVVSGVEAAPGRKDPDRVRAFITAARTAAQSLRPQSLVP